MVNPAKYGNTLPRLILLTDAVEAAVITQLSSVLDLAIKLNALAAYCPTRIGFPLGRMGEIGLEPWCVTHGGFTTAAFGVG